MCCDKGSVFIKPMRKYPTELEKLMFGKGVNAKKFRGHILSYNNAYSFASIQYNRIPAAAHGVQSMKVQGEIYSLQISPASRKSRAFPILCLAIRQ